MTTQHYFYFICNLLTILGLNRFLKKAYGEKHLFLSIAGLIAYYLVDCAITLINSKASIFFITSFLTFLLVSFSYSQRFAISNVLSAIILQVFSACSELIASFIVSLFAQNTFDYSGDTIIILTIVIAKIMLFLLLLIASFIIRNNDVPSPLYQFLGLFIIPALSIFQVLYIFKLQKFDQYTIRDSGSVEALLAVFSVVAMNIIACFTIDKQRKVLAVENEKNNLITIVKMQQDYYDKENKNREHIQRMRHDFKNFLIGIRSDIISGNINNAISIIDNQLKEEYVSPSSKSNLLAIDSVLSYKCRLANDLGISIIPQYKITAEPHIASSDISVLIGNALDNAIEYLSTHSNCNQTINFRIIYEKGVLDILIENEIEEPISFPADSHFISTKGPNHGYGIKSAEYIVHKYSGNLLVSCNKNIFSFCAIMYC